MLNTKTHTMQQVFQPEGMPTMASYTAEMNIIWNRIMDLPFGGWTKEAKKEKAQREKEIAFPIGTVVFLQGTKRLARVVEFTKAGNPKLDNGDILRFVATFNIGGLHIEGRTEKGVYSKKYHIAIPNMNA